MRASLKHKLPTAANAVGKTGITEPRCSWGQCDVWSPGSGICSSGRWKGRLHSHMRHSRWSLRQSCRNCTLSSPCFFQRLMRSQRGWRGSAGNRTVAC